jgi:hypothetical protein
MMWMPSISSPKDRNDQTIAEIRSLVLLLMQVFKTPRRAPRRFCLENKILLFVLVNHIGLVCAHFQKSIFPDIGNFVYDAVDEINYIKTSIWSNRDIHRVLKPCGETRKA